MSAEHVGWAFRQKGLTPTRKLVLLALADRCNKDTLRCDPKIKTLMEDTGLAQRSVFRALEDLEDAGLIARVSRTRDNGSLTSSEFRFPHVTVAVPPRQRGSTPPVTVAPPEPEVRTRTEPTPAAAPRKRDEIWDTLTHIFGEPATRTEQSKRGKVVSSLRMAKATPEEIIRRAGAWPLHWPELNLTETALEARWTELGRKPLRRTR